MLLLHSRIPSTRRISWICVVETLSLPKGGDRCHPPFDHQTAGGKQRLNCANTESIFRIIKSIHYAKTEPVKRWLARGGIRTDTGKSKIQGAISGQRALLCAKAKGHARTHEKVEKHARDCRREKIDGMNGKSETK